MQMHDEKKLEKTVTTKLSRETEAEFNKLMYEMNSDKCYFTVSDWEKIVSFDEYDLPKFDLNVFPDSLKRFIISVSDFTQTPDDLAAICLIGMLSVSLQNKFEVEPIKGWSESLNTYSTVLLGPSNRKSAVFNLFMTLVLSYQQELEVQYNKKMKENELQISILEKQIEKLKTDYVKTKKVEFLDEMKELHDKKIELSSLAKNTFILDNVTEEKLVSTLFENEEKVGIFSSEGDLFERFKSSVRMDSHKTDVYLKAYSGDALRVDRISRSTEILYSPALTICISAQPTVIEDMPKKIIDRGLIPRFLIAVPNDTLGQRDIFNAPNLDENLKSKYNDFIRKLLEFECSEPIILNLSDEAFQLLKQQEYEIEQLFLKDQLYHKELRGWGGKLLGNLLRLAGLIHVATHAQNSTDLNEIPTVIEKSTLQNVFDLKEYFDMHIQKAFGIMRNTVTYEDARYLLDKILNYAEIEITFTIEKQKIWQNTKKKFLITAKLNEALSILEDRGYIQMAMGGVSGNQHTIVVNPGAMKSVWNKQV